jgi:hypothetical protein
MVDAQAKNASSIVQLTAEDMQRHEAVMRMKLEEAEKEPKKQGIEKQKFFDRGAVQDIATPIEV